MAPARRWVTAPIRAPSTGAPSWFLYSVALAVEAICEAGAEGEEAVQSSLRHPATLRSPMATQRLLLRAVMVTVAAGLPFAWFDLGWSGVATRGFQPIILPKPGQGAQLAMSSVGGVPTSALPIGEVSTPDAILETTVSLDGSPWDVVTTTPVLLDGRFTVTTACTDRTRFFRLRHP